MVQASEALSAQKKENLASSGHKLQSPSKKFEAPGKENYMTLFNGVINQVTCYLFPSEIPTLSTKERGFRHSIAAPMNAAGVSLKGGSGECSQVGKILRYVPL